MRDVHVISLIGLIYAIILSIVTLIFFNTHDYPLWAVLGAAVSLFNHSLMIQVTKKFSTERLITHLVQRYVFYFIIMLYIFLETRNLETNIMINSYIFFLLGVFSTKIGVFIYHTPLIKKPEPIKEEVTEEEIEDEDNH